MNARTYGDFEYIPESLVPEAQVDISISPIELTTHWERCGLLSDMTAGYIAYAYPGGMKRHESAIFSSISTIFQELMENAARYSRQRETVIKARVKHYNRVVRIEVQNDSTPAYGQKFEDYLKVLFSATDLDEMYMQLMEDQAAGLRQSGIGLLLLLKDYPVKLGAQLLRDGNERDVIVVRAYYHMEISDEDMLSGDIFF
jgi:hypothetical protein